MQRNKRTRKISVRRGTEYEWDTKCYARETCQPRHKQSLSSSGDAMNEDFVTLSHNGDDSKIRAGKAFFFFYSLCFHFEFSKATDKHTGEKMSSEPHLTRKTDETRKSKNWNQKAFTHSFFSLHFKPFSAFYIRSLRNKGKKALSIHPEASVVDHVKRSHLSHLSM